MKTKFTFISILAIAFMLASCNSYRKISYSKNTVFKKKPVKEKIDSYDIYIHQDDATYRLEDPVISEDTLGGVVVSIDSNPLITMDSLNDMHIFVNEDAVINSTDDQFQTFTKDNVKNVEIYATPKSGLGKVFLIVVLAFLGALVALLIIGVVALATSGESDSGGSNSGGSDSGGSDSGCYVATMSYGSYDAPQVLILREFRDRFLQKFGAGRAFIAWYYKHSPSFVEKHRSKKWLHSTLRLPLNILVFFIKPFYTGENAEK